MAYTRVNWINEQEGTTTPLNATNLNTMDAGIADVDERVTTLENTPTQADAYKTIVVGDDSLVASGADSFELVAGSNVTITADADSKQITIASSGGGGGSGHTMVDTIDDVLSAQKTDNKVVNAFTVADFSNVYTECIGAILTQGNNVLGKWFEDGETWDVTQMLQDNRLKEQNGEKLNIQFDYWIGDAIGTDYKANTQVLHISGYQWDSTAGAISIKCAETANNDITIVIKITHIRERA